MKLDPNIKNQHFDNCIICKKRKPDTYEHLIPDSIGGVISMRILCKKCNDELGHTLVANVKKDPRIRIAISNLKIELPDLYKKIEDGQAYETTDKKGNLIKMTFKNGKHRTISQKIGEYLIVDDSEIDKKLKEMLSKKKQPTKKIQEKIDSFKNVKRGEEFEFIEGSIVKKREIGEIRHSFTGEIITNRFLVLVAYEFISFFLGKLIYDERLDYIRDYISLGKESNLISIESYSTNKYAPINRIYCEDFEKNITVNILLFGNMLFKVNILNFPFRFSDIVILEDLVEKRAFAAKSIKEAKNGNYEYEIKKPV